MKRLWVSTGTETADDDDNNDNDDEKGDFIVQYQPGDGAFGRHEHLEDVAPGVESLATGIIALLASAHTLAGIPNVNKELKDEVV